MDSNFFTGFIRNCWYVGAWSQELQNGQVIARTIIDTPLVMYRTEDGECVVLEDRCCHRLAPLSQGRCEGRDIRCLYHGMLFNPSGSCVEIPGQENIPDDYVVQAFPSVERYGTIWVWMGEQYANPELIPDLSDLDAPDHKVQHGVMEYEANYSLLNDNLLDFSHVSYLHRDTLKPSEDWAYTRPKVERLERGVRVYRWLPSQPPIPSSGYDGRIDFWNAYYYMVPGLLIMRSAMYPEGTAQKVDYEQPDDAMPRLPGAGSACHAATPCSVDKTRYFYSTIVPNKNNTDDFAAENFRDVTMALEEDRQMVEKQHRILKLSENSKMRATTFDNALTQYRWVVQNLINQERIN